MLSIWIFWNFCQLNMIDIFQILSSVWRNTVTLLISWLYYAGDHRLSSSYYTVTVHPLSTSFTSLHWSLTNTYSCNCCESYTFWISHEWVLIMFVCGWHLCSTMSSIQNHFVTGDRIFNFLGMDNISFDVKF